MPSKNRIDPESIPKDYLQAYPYPAFVLITPTPTSQQNQAGTSASAHTGQGAFQPFEVFWGNDSWKNFVKESTLLECLDVDGARSLGKWISGIKSLEQLSSSPLNQKVLGLADHLANFSLSLPATSGRKLPQDGKPETDNTSESISEIDAALSPRTALRPSISNQEDQDQTAATPTPSSSFASTTDDKLLLLDFLRPVQVKFELLKTYMPIWCASKGSGRNKLATHSFVIITTIPRSDYSPSYHKIPKVEPAQDVSSATAAEEGGLELDAKPTTKILTPSDSPTHHTLRRPIPSAYSSDPSVTNKSVTPTEELTGFDFGAKKSTAIRYGRDGAITRPAQWNSNIVDVHDLMQSTDWAATALGPRESWPQSLKTTVSLVLHYPHQCCLWWGKDLTLIYNEAYAQMMIKHPHIFGMSGAVAWAEIWDALGPISELVLSGTPVTKEDDFLLFKQLPHQGGGSIEEYHTWMWVPVLQEDGTFGGLWNATIATTSKVLAERRMSTVQEMGQRTSVARTMEEFDEAVIDILAANARDVPFAAFYHVDLPSVNARKGTGGPNSAEMTKDVDQFSGIKANIRLAGAVGIPDNHPTTPSSLTITVRPRVRNSLASLRSGPRSPSLSITSSMSNALLASSSAHSDIEEEDPKTWPIKEALLTNRLVMVENCESLISGYPIRVWDELPTAAVVIPISNESNDGVPSAVLILGLNIRRPFDEDYESFILIIFRRLRVQLASGIAAVRSYEAERQRVEELAALDRAKSLLFSNVSHELRTPLTLIAGPLDDLLQETAEGPRKENLVMARRNVRRLTRLVSTLMDVSRLEAGRLKGSFQLVNLGIMTRDLAVLFKGAMKQAKLEYLIDCDLSPQAVYIDPEHWEKVVYNLIGNAMKYTMEGFVRLSLKYRRGEAVFAVQDSGVGIPSTDIDLIGERFHRVQSISRSHEGTGIGLALVKELIKLHGGAMSINSVTALESVDGSHGSTFAVRIPLGSDHLPSDAVEDDQIVSKHSQTTYGQGIIDEAIQWTRDRDHSNASSVDGSEIGSTSEETTSRGSKSLDPSTLYFKREDVIMLVDDSFDTRRYMSSIFSPLCTIIEAKDGLDALRLCEKTIPDLIISDVMMPNLDGFGLLEALKTSKELSITPVIMLTARGGDEAKVDGLLAGADDYLAKPFNSRELVARAHMQLQLGKRRRSLEEAFEQRTSELRALTEYSPVGIFRTTEDGTITFTNNAWHAMSGYPTDEPADRWLEVIAEEFRPPMLEFWDRVLRRDEDDEEISKSIDYQFTNGNWVQLKAIRLEKLGEKVGSKMKGILGCVNDITERKLNEESQKMRVVEAEQRRKEAEEAKRQQELLIDITSHEIRNPISSLMQCSSLVKTNLLSLQEQLEAVHSNKTSFIPTKQLLNNIEEDLDALESIYQCGLAQERISNDVLSLGKIQLDKLQMFDVEVDMARETQKTLSIFQNEARMKRIKLSLVLGEGLENLNLKMVKTDPVRLNQIVTNLLSNAIRFTSASHIKRITLKFDVSLDPPLDEACVIPKNQTEKIINPTQIKEDQPIYLYFAVTDTGPGMTEAELEMLFQRFSQVSLKTHTIFGGSGLGLFVCRQITHMMGGKIDVTSTKGKGTTFRFYIKARTTQPTNSLSQISTADGIKESGDLSKKSTLVKSKKKDIFQFEGKKPHVLIVEDNLINQTVLARQLKHCNITCDVASHGLEALEKIRKVCSINSTGQPFDCILMDLEMPVMDGLTALDHIRKEESLGQLKKNLVIALTGNARQGQIDEAKSRGMDEVIIKPYRLDDMLQKVEEMMKIRNYEQEQEDSNPTPTTPIIGSEQQA
uniref:Uncharacterized protein n=1 Tax=Kwoniella pini CBS 10737 TaxID=1296096 RepID=A0A1B9I4B9_9TREE|nr:uncharacterized protein I206_03688 [Kwoniella pini CBS 10737]OCF50367.1 hypothetical protein I206_03688 [Kwoniella pini CBS 10737]